MSKLGRKQWKAHKEYDGRVSDEGDGRGQLALVATRVVGHTFVGVLHQVETLQRPVGGLQETPDTLQPESLDIINKLYFLATMVHP